MSPQVSWLRFFTPVAFRLLLAVSLWEGPVLWGHVHTEEAPALDTHLTRFHLHDASPWNLGWHWHFSYPEHDGTVPSGGKQTDLTPPRVLPDATELQHVTFTQSLASICLHAAGSRSLLPSAATGPAADGSPDLLCAPQPRLRRLSC